MAVLDVAVTLVGKFTAHSNPNEFNASRSRWVIELGTVSTMLENWGRDDQTTLDRGRRKVICAIREERAESLFNLSNSYCILYIPYVKIRHFSSFVAKPNRFSVSDVY
ncbi:hypothetical protein J6590_072157 [Homalodisca vitripennis]|nr:hypothetical protein J6590_072156 [Homalodisca vitripennis]KAG8266439.1 hypothetical protein J6590_072157 [Homalodisca vitripennis]